AACTRVYFVSSQKNCNLIHHLCVLVPLSLSLPAGAGGWSPLTSDRYQWLEVDLGERTKITAVATQGRYGSSDWLTSYLLMFSDTGHNWKQYRQEDSIGSFPGNSNADSVVQYKLQQPAIARFLRLIPLDRNPSGRIGLRLEAYGCPYTSDVVSFGGGSSGLVSRLSPGPRRTSREVVSMKFKTLRNSGTLLHAEGEGGLGFSLELERGKLLLLLRRGDSSSEPRRLASLGSLLDDQHWHLLAVERRSTHLNLTVDKHTERVQIPAEFSRWDIEQVQGLVSERDFHGCLENLQYNGLNLIELAKNKDHRVSGNVTFSCAESVFVAVTFPGPQSFLQLPGARASSSGGVSVGFQFRTWNKAGLLLTFDLPQEGGVVWLYLSEARLRLQIHKAGRALLELSAGSALNDGQWHSVDLTSKQGHVTIAVDKGEGVYSTFNSDVSSTSTGCPAEEDGQSCRNPFSLFQGCMRLLSVENQPVDLIMVQQRLLGNYSHLQIDMCGIIDRCSPSRCEHGGRCSQSWTVFHCNCSESGYSGATCHSSEYEQSCEAYKHKGNTSGHFYIDVDGSGPIRPQLVYCNMTGDTHTHTHTHTLVRPSPGVDQHSVHFDYSTEEEQLLVVISQSKHCEQELSYHCRKSQGSPFSWWLGGPGPGRVQMYWGGAQPGSQQCVCGLQGDCVDPQHYCNCDADRVEWAEDSGLLTHGESLPVRSLVMGDIQRPESEAAYRVGPLRCHGDKNFWNAAFFDKETSYLHFPTFHGELSADVSFLFKTTAPSGVFLENLGIKDFIRIELSSSTRVVFSFDVGNGPLEVGVESSVPLNDDRWHRVRAERNVKEASLRLDQLPVARREAPADGHLHLQLNSQLFIEVSASFKPGTSVSYSFKELYELGRNSSARPSSIYSDVTLRAENVSLSFRTNQSPALLLYVGSYHRESLALLVNKLDKLEVRYKLDSGRDAEVLRSRVKSLADGRLHSVTVRRLSDSVSLQVTTIMLRFGLHSCTEFNAVKSLVLGRVDPELSRLASLGFTGCLSVVHFNSISPLKAALLHPHTSPVVISGPLVQSSCGSSASANPHAAEDTHHLSGRKGRSQAGLTDNCFPGSLCVGRFLVIKLIVFIFGTLHNLTTLSTSVGCPCQSLVSRQLHTRRRHFGSGNNTNWLDSVKDCALG
uniref:Contactin associated protein like 3 n=1 Tax=Cyclopterus lumpus TaxID=8103 RepID=A0A8C3A8G5_CYCLU